MQIPVEVAFHNIQSTSWAEEEIRARIAKLEKIYDRLTTCRVRVEQRARNSARTIPPVVRIELSVPGYKDIVVAHEPEHLQRKFQTPELKDAIGEAFRVAEKRLLEFKRKLRMPTTDGGQDTENRRLGQIADLPAGQDFGFLLTETGALLYFHRNSMLSGDFKALRKGDEVTYVEDMGDTGPTAGKVRPKAQS
ncbi:MAG: HPF/RaiA family ribosome-associated protein [Parvibaculaceae bacterium]